MRPSVYNYLWWSLLVKNRSKHSWTLLLLFLFWNVCIRVCLRFNNLWTNSQPKRLLLFQQPSEPTISFKDEWILGSRNYFIGLECMCIDKRNPFVYGASRDRLLTVSGNVCCLGSVTSASYKSCSSPPSFPLCPLSQKESDGSTSACSELDLENLMIGILGWLLWRIP